MIATILASLVLLIQGIPVRQGGTVTGVLRDSQGMPVAGVRMAAVARGDSVEEVVSGAAMAGLAETDEQGRFTLEDIPPGRYSIAAGRLDLQTYYPGTQNLSEATVVTVSAGQTISGINFALNDASVGRSTFGNFGVSAITATIPVHVVVEGGGPLPVSWNGNYVKLSLGSTSIPIESSAFTVQGPVTGDFRVTVQNLPDSYVVNEIKYGSSDITQGFVRLTSANFATTSIAMNISAPAAQPAGPGGNTQAVTTALSLASYALSLNRATLRPAVSPPLTISVTLRRSEQAVSSGVRVSGKSAAVERRLVYISGHPGIFFADGTFEFKGVPAGRHVIATVNNPSSPMAAVVVVGDKDLDGVELEETPLLPQDIRTPKDPQPAGSYGPGSIVPLARVSGIVIEEVQRTPIGEGEVTLSVENYSWSIPVEANGHFEIFRLVPGTYGIKVQIFGHTTNATSITVGDKDLQLELTPRRLY